MSPGTATGLVTSSQGTMTERTGLAKVLSAVTLETIPSIHRLEGSSLYMVKRTFYVPNETVGESVPITFLGKTNRTCWHE